MKIAVVGAGSTYAPELAHGLAQRAEALGLVELAQYDTDPARLQVVGGFVRRMCARLAPQLEVSAPGSLDAALEGADFVIVQIRVGGQAARLEDERLGKQHGVIGQETTGVGGLAKALRTVPAVLHIAERARAVCPDATLINFSNPVSIVTEALLRHGQIRTIGLCNIPISQRMEIAAHLGVDPDSVEIDSVGLNHLSFIRGVKVGGQDALPRLLEDLAAHMRSGAPPANIPDLDFPSELLLSLGMIPSDYLRYFFLAPETVAEQQAKAKLRAEEVMDIETELLALYADPEQHDKPDALSQRGGAFYSHAALEIIEAVAGDTGRVLTVDTRNSGCVAELPEQAAIEVPCRVDARGAHPLPQRPLEPVIRGLVQHVKAYEELAVQAALSGDRKDVFQAVLAHPLTQSATLASALTDGIMPRLPPRASG